MTRIWLVRHGQTAWNVGSTGGERFRGQMDLPLNEVGEAQAQAVAAALAEVPLAAVYASPLQRAQQTARPTAEQHGLPVQVLPGLLDINYGQWAGLTPMEVAEGWPELYRLWREAPQRVQVPGGENLAVVRERALAAVEEVCLRHPEEQVMLVGHQVVNRVLVVSLLGLELSAFWRIEQDTACINCFDYRDGHWIARLINDTCHLRGKA